MDTRCVITGVTLISPDRDEWVSADLYFQGEDTFIVVANFREYGETAWNKITEDDTWLDTAKKLYLSTYFFEKRGVFVINKEDVQEMSAEAVQYLLKGGITL